MKSIRSICIAVTLLCLIQVTLARYCCGCCRKVGLCGGFSPTIYCAGNECSIRKPYNGGCCVNCGGCCSCCPCCYCCCPIYDETSTYSVDTTPVVPTVTATATSPVVPTVTATATSPVVPTVTAIATSPVVPTVTPGVTITPGFSEDITPVTQNVLDTLVSPVSVTPVTVSVTPADVGDVIDHIIDAPNILFDGISS